MSETMPELASVANAKAAHEKAGKALLRAMVRALPEGTDVEIPSGRRTIRGTVVGHGHWWYDQTSVLVKVASTGNLMRLHCGHLIPEPERSREGEVK